MATLFFRIGVLLGLVAVVVIAVLPLRRQFADFHELVRRTPPMQRTLLALLAAVFIAYGGTKTNQVDQAGGTNEVEMAGGGGQSNLSTAFLCATEQESNILCPPPPVTSTSSSPSPLAFTSAAPVVTPEEIARGWQVWEVRTNAAVDYAMPEGAVLASNWWMRGAYEDVVRIGNGDRGTGIGEWLFPFGTNEYSSLWAFSWGKVRFARGSTNAEIVAVGAPMSAVPYRSRLWSAAGADGSWLVTWEDFALNRDTNTPVNAQIELRPSGDFVTRSNEVETVCRRVDPEDWDGDGWRNEDDPDPYAWDEYWDSFWQELPDGANESAYCWIEIRPRWHSYIEFVGDGPSDLDDPYLWAKAGETYRVRLLIGKTYTIVSSQPLEVVGRSSPLIVIDGNGTREIEVVWPVTFSALEGNGSSFMMRVVPSGLGGTFSWTQHCCGLTGYGNQFWWAHERSCCCGGCSASGVYSYEGYEKDCIGGHCCCPRYDDDDPYAPQEDDGPYAAGASVGFSKAVVIFGDAYTNMPGEVVARRSTQTTLACIAHGGETGGTATFSIENGAKLVSRSGGSLPVTRFVPPKQKIEFEIVYEGRLPSDSEGDIKAKADFTERGTGTRHSTRVDRMTVVKVLISPEELPPENSSPNRHLLGVQEKVYYHLWPETVEVALSDGDRGRDIFIDDYEQCFYCPWTGGVYAVSVECASQNYDIPLTVIEPGVECIGARWNESLDANAVEDSSGWVGMVLLLYLTPRTVAFQRISMVEIPVLESEAHELAPDDYFALMPDVLTKTHDSRAGAGRWKMPQLIGNGYYWTGDFAQMPRECPPLTNCLERVWAQGLMRWDIPVGWGEPNVVRGSMRQNPTEQVYEIEPDGTLTIRKYQHWIKRDISGRVWLDGSRVNAWWSDLW